MSNIDKLEKIQKLKEQGVLTETEFEQEKKKILSNNPKEETNINSKMNNIKEKVNKSKKIRKCKKCGSEIHEGEKFCGKCGTEVKKFKIKKYQIIVAISIVVLLAIVGIIGAVYYNNTVITDDFLTENFKQNGFEQFENVNVKALAIKDITYDGYNKLVVANVDVTINGVNMQNTGILLVNKKENKVEGLTTNTVLSYLIKGIANSNTKETSPQIAAICVKYIQNKGTDCFNNIESEDFKSLMKEIGDIVGIEKSRNFIKTEYAKVVSNANINLDYTLLFEKDSALIKYIAFYETSVEFNPKYPMSEKTYKLAFGDYSDKSSRQTLEYLYGPPYITVKKYNVYTINTSSSNEQEFEDTKVGSYNTLEEAEEQLNVEE